MSRNAAYISAGPCKVSTCDFGINNTAVSNTRMVRIVSSVGFLGTRYKVPGYTTATKIHE